MRVELNESIYTCYTRYWFKKWNKICWNIKKSNTAFNKSTNVLYELKKNSWNQENVTGFTAALALFRRQQTLAHTAHHSPRSGRFIRQNKKEMGLSVLTFYLYRLLLAECAPICAINFARMHAPLGRGEQVRGRLLDLCSPCLLEGTNNARATGPVPSPQSWVRNRS